MASTQADVLISKQFLIPGEENSAASMLRAQRRSGGGNLLPQTDYPSERIAESRRNRQGSTGTDVGKRMSFEAISSQYREARQAANQSKIGGTAKQAIKAVAASAIQQGTSKLLQQSWINLIDSYGLTLLWINVHVFLRWTVGDQYFCKLGHEWLSSGKAGKAGGAATGSSNLILGLSAGGLGYLEAGTLAALDLIILLLILAGLAIPVFIVYIVVNPTEAIQLIGLTDFINLIQATLF